MMDREAGNSTVAACSYLHTIALGDSLVCVELAEGGGKGEVKFVPLQELLSLSLGHTWFHQGARPSFIIDANLFKAD